MLLKSVILAADCGMPWFNHTDQDLVDAACIFAEKTATRFLAAARVAPPARARATVLEVLQSDYIRTAYAKGLPPVTVLFAHALKNAAVPVVTTIGVGFALLIGGVVITESVFNIPGVARFLVEAIRWHHDYQPATQNADFTLIIYLSNIIVNSYDEDPECVIDLTALHPDARKFMLNALVNVGDWYAGIAEEIQSAYAFFLDTPRPA